VVALGIAGELPVEVPMEINIAISVEFGNHFPKVCAKLWKNAANW